jgi:CelD/BcsL family acetyltransferase involved in cellulose biosynthesis
MQMAPTNQSTVMRTPLVFEAVQGLAGYRKLESDWLTLADELAEECWFQHRPQWTRAFLESGICNPETVWIISARRAGKLVGIAPLQFQDYRIGNFKPRILGTLEDDQLQLSDFVFRKQPENADFYAQLVAWLRRQNTLRWDSLRLRKVRQDSAIWYAASHKQPSQTLALQHDESAYFETASGYDHATASMTGDFRRNMRRQLRRAEEAHKVRAETATSGEDLQRAFQVFLEIEASGWKGDEGLSSAIRCQPALLGFYQSLLDQFGARGECVINLLWFGDEPVAGEFAIRIGRILHILKFGYKESAHKFAPGNVLLDKIIAQTCEDPGIDVLNLVNHPVGAVRFKPHVTGVWSYVTPNHSLGGVLTHIGLMLKRALDRRKEARAAATAKVTATVKVTDAAES